MNCHIILKIETAVMNKSDSVQERICQFYGKNKKLGNTTTFKHSFEEGIRQSTINDEIKSVKNGIGAKRCKGQGIRSEKIHPKKVDQFKKFFKKISNSGRWQLRNFSAVRMLPNQTMLDTMPQEKIDSG